MTAIKPVIAATIIPDFGLNVLNYGALGDGVTNDTAAIQAAINDAATSYASTGSSTIVLFPSGYEFLSGQLFILPGVTLWAYGATIQATLTGWSAHGYLTWRPGGNPPPAGSILTDFSILGGLWIGSGSEDWHHNQYWVEGPPTGGVQNFTIRDTTVTGWGWVPIKILNPTNADISDNHFYGNEIATVNNTGFQNALNIFIDNTAAFGGEFKTCRNTIHNATADAIGVVIGLGAPGPSNGRLGWIASENILTSDPPRIDTDGSGGATVTVTSGSSTVLDSECGASDVNAFITGPGIPNVTYISAVTPGVSFTMSKNATGNGTQVSVGVYKSSITLEIDATTVPITDYTIVNNDLVGYERAPISIALPNTKTTHRAIVANNRVYNGQTGVPSDDLQGSGISVHGQSAAADVEITNNRVTAPHKIAISGTSFTNRGLQSGNKFTTDPIQGQAVLVTGTATVSTTEIQTGDNVILSRVVTGGTIGSLSVGTITDQTSFTITSSSATDTSTIYWKIDH